MRISRFVLIIFLISSTTLFAQRKLGMGAKKEKTGVGMNPNDSIRQGRVKVKLSGITKYTDYKIISFDNDTTYIDTTLTLEKERKSNFLRKDLFELLPFQNAGQTFNSLAYDFNKTSQFPDIGFSGKQFFYQNVRDINYYRVPTPTSEIMFRSTFEQGQFLESFFTANFSKRFNISVEYTGLRSLGKYRASLASQGNFSSTFTYQTKENQYRIRGHVASQDLLNEENGGLTDASLQAFLSDDPNFSERARLDVNLEDTENTFKGSRLYFEHDFKILSSKDSVSNKDFSNLKVGHTFLTEGKFYEFRQTTLNSAIFGSTNASGAISDKTTYSLLKNQFFLEFNSKYVLGRFRVKSDLVNYQYGYEDLRNITTGINTRKLKGSAASLGAEWKAKVKDFQLFADGSVTPGQGRLSGSNLQGKLSYDKDSLFSINASLVLNSKQPNFNYILHQSAYTNYNWFNNFDNITTQDLGFDFDSKWVKTSVNFTTIQNFTYFDENSSPIQSRDNVTYLKVKANKEFKRGKFALDNTIMYQNVSSGSSIFRVPEFVTRNTLYYSDYWFQGNPLKVNIGVTFKYFTDYFANAYDPLLAEFRLQNNSEIGFSTVDIFFNAQVRRTRLFFKIDNALSGVGKRNYFSAPGYPYRDFVIRFGLVWNWFI